MSDLKLSKDVSNRFEEAYSSQKNRFSTSPKQYYMEESIFDESLSTSSPQADKKLNPVNGGHGYENYIPKEEVQTTNSSQVDKKLNPVNGGHSFVNYVSKEETENASKAKEKSVEEPNKTTTENPVEKSAEKSNESPKDKATENSIKEPKEGSKEVKSVEKVEKTKKTKTKPTGNGKRFNFFKGKKGKFGAILAGIALVGAAIAYVVNKAGDKVDKAKDVKAEKPVENTTQIEETPEIVEQIPVAPVEAPVQEENDGDVVTVKPGDTVWDLCEQKLKERGNGNPTAKQIRELVDKVMADEDNKLHWESDNYTVIIKPGQEIRICKPEE